MAKSYMPGPETRKMPPIKMAPPEKGPEPRRIGQRSYDGRMTEQDRRRLGVDEVQEHQIIRR